MKQHSLGVLSLALALAGAARAVLDPYSRCGGYSYSGETDCPSGYDCVEIAADYSACIEYGTYPGGPGYTDGCPSLSPVTVTYTKDCTTGLPYTSACTSAHTSSYSTFTSVYSPSPYTSAYSPSPVTPLGYSSAHTPSPYTSTYTPSPYTSVYVYTSPVYTSSPTYTPQGYSSSSAYVPPYSSSSVYVPPYSSSSAYIPPYSSSSAHVLPYSSSTAYVPRVYSSSVPPVYTSVFIPPTYTTSPSYLPSVIDTTSTDYTSVPYISVELPSYTSSYVPPVYTPLPHESSYAPDTEEPSYTPPNPFPTTPTAIVIVDPPQETNPVGNPTGSFTPVIGAPGVELRLPIGELQSNYPDIWNMFCLGLESLMAVDESLDLGYYQLSGIHGIPYIPWQYPVDPATQDPTRGYCTHSSALFSTWHRPYLVLVEQTLVAHAVSEAAKFTGADAQRYQDAAKKVRIPYWDWSSEDTKSHLPPVTMLETLNVVKPAPGTGAPTQTTISNPLYAYTFKNDDYRNTYFQAGFFRDTDSTRRQPDSNGVSRNPLADQEMANTYDSRRQNTFNLFSIPTFQGFTSNAWDGGSAPNAWTSVESIHNNIHAAVGGTLGHMSYVDYAAFDPIFWLHHAQVDRLTAMYQAIWPDNTVVPQAASGTFARKAGPGVLDTIDTPLYPFRHPSGIEWTSRDVSSAKSIYTYGYAYPEVPAEYQGRSDDELQLFVTSAVNTEYRPALSEALTPAPPGGVVRREWVAHMAYDQSELPGALDVLLYVGTVPENVSDWHTAPDLVGDCASFGDQSSHKSHVIKATVPLTKTLLDNNIGLDPVDVVKYLRANCHWVIKQGGYSIPVSELTSLRVGVSSTNVAYPDDYTQLAVWGQAQTHYDVTDGRDGGLQSNETYLVDSVEAPPVLSLNSTAPYNSTAVRRYASYY